MSLLSIWETQRAKEKSLLFCPFIQTFTQGFYDRLLSRGVCENALAEGKLRRGTSTIPYNKINKAAKKYERAKKRKISQAVQRETPLRSRFPSSLIILQWRVLGCGARARSAKVCGVATAAPQCLKAALVIDKHTSWCQI